MAWRGVGIGLLCLCLALASPWQTALGQDSAADQLVEQAQYWEARGRYDLARDAWLKLLRTDKNNADALSGMGSLEARAGRPAAAQVYLDRLKAAHPNSAAARDLQASITQASISQEDLDRARALAQDGQYDQAVRIYRDIFGETEPQGRLALEYYQTLAGAENGWEPARRGLERLAQTYDTVPISKLALAQHLTYREQTRRSGISQLATLTEESSVADQAKQAWRQALIWLRAGEGDARYYRAYLNKYGQDEQLDRKLASLSRPQPGTPEVDPVDALIQQAYEDLNAGELDLAYTGFEEVLRLRPDNADALGGLGIILLRQEQFGPASEYLRRAQAAEPRRAKRWQEALDSADFWYVVRQADAARQVNDVQRAIGLYEQALARRPDEYSVRNTLGDVLAEQGELDRAAAQFQVTLSAQPNNIDAIRGMIGVLTRQGNSEGALALAQRVPADQRNELGNLSTLQAQFLRDRAGRAIDAGNDPEAERWLREALILDPQSPWVRLDLARVYQRQGRTREANTLIDGLLDSNPRMPDALYIKAQLVSENQQWYEGLRLLERVPLQSRAGYMADLQQRLWVRYQTERAAVYSRLGRPEQAIQILRQVEPLVGDKPELLGALAGALAEVGEEGEALRYMRQALALQVTPDPGLRTQYASLLFKLRQDAEFEVQVDDLERSAGLTRQQRTDLAKLQVAYRLRRADLIREQGDLATAYEFLEPMLKVNPEDPRLLMALARLYTDAEEFDRAAAIYDRVLAVAPENIDAYKGAVGAQIAKQDFDLAERLLNTALELDPENPRLYALGGRLARIRGQDGRALQFFRQALALDAQRKDSDLGGVDSWRHAPTLYLIDPEPPARVGQATPPGATGPGTAVPQRSSAIFNDLNTPAVASSRPVVSAPVRVASVEDRYESIPTQDGSRLLKMSTANRLNEVVSPSPQTAWTQVAQVSQPVPAPVYVDTRAPPGYPIANRFDRSLSAPSAVVTAPPVQRYTFTNRPQTPAEGEIVYEGPPLSAPPTTLGDRGSQVIYEYPVQQAPIVYDTPVYNAPVVEGEVIYEYPVAEAPVIDDYPAQPVSPPERAVPPPQPKPRRVAPPRDPRDDILREISEIREQRSAWGAVGLSLRNRDGQDGLEQLLDIELPGEFSITPAEGRFRVRAVPVLLDAGTLSGRELALFGAMPLVEGVIAQQRPELRFDQDDAGVALQGVYEVGQVRLDFGSTPIGFREEDVQGGILWQPRSRNLVWKLDASRRPVTDSLLSYAGAFDPALGVNFGGVSKTGLRVDLAYDGGRYGTYVNGGFHLLDGNNVDDNSVLEVGAGFYARALETPRSRVTWGVNATTLFYDKNRRYFTLGHGGYFSPQFYISLGVPVEWTGRLSRLSYRLSGALGLQAFRESSAPYFPTSTALQQALADFAAAEPTLDVDTFYEGQSVTGLGFNLEGEAEYLLSPHVSVGGTFGFDNARDFEQTSFMGFVKYWFRPQRQAHLPPSVLKPDWVGDPTQQ